MAVILSTLPRGEGPPKNESINMKHSTSYPTSSRPPNVSLKDTDVGDGSLKKLMVECFSAMFHKIK